MGPRWRRRAAPGHPPGPANSAPGSAGPSPVQDAVSRLHVAVLHHDGAAHEAQVSRHGRCGTRRVGRDPAAGGPEPLTALPPPTPPGPTRPGRPLPARRDPGMPRPPPPPPPAVTHVAVPSGAPGGDATAPLTAGTGSGSRHRGRGVVWGLGAWDSARGRGLGVVGGTEMWGGNRGGV